VGYCEGITVIGEAVHTEYLRKIIELLNECKIYKKNEVYDDWEMGFEELFQQFYQTKKKQRQLFLVGNGGSAAIASHMTADFMKNGGMHTISLYGTALTTCMGNDYGYEYVFSKLLEMLMQPEDLLVAISSSGNSQNIVNAIEVAKQREARVVTFSGFDADNRIKQMGDWNVYVPIRHYGMVESIHNLLLQQIVDEIMELDGTE
jgi:D-sedoheptulose 7-phosphate isomerase